MANVKVIMHTPNMSEKKHEISYASESSAKWEVELCYARGYAKLHTPDGGVVYVSIHEVMAMEILPGESTESNV